MERLTGVYMSSSYKGWTAGWYIMASTTDGGLTWTEEPTYLSDFESERLRYTGNSLWAVGGLRRKPEPDYRSEGIMLKRDVTE